MIFNKKILYGILILVVTAAAIILISGNADKKENSDGKEATTENKQEDTTPSSSNTSGKRSAVKVTAGKVFIGDLVKRVSAFGTAEAQKQVEIKPLKQGIIKKIHVREGSRVKKGDLLFSLDDRSEKLALKRAKNEKIKTYSDYLVYELDYKYDSTEKENRLKSAQKKYNEAKQKFSNKIITKAELDEAKRIFELTKEAMKIKRDDVRKSTTGVTASEIQVQEALLELEKTKIRAPFSGVITDINITEGQDTSSIKEAAMILVGYDKIKIVADVLENEIAALEPGRKVKVDFVAIEKQTYDANIGQISPLVDEEKKTGKVYIYMENPENKIKPGMHARIRLDAHIFEDRLLVPRPAVLLRDGKPMVFVIRDGRAEWEYVRTGLENEEYIEIIPDSSIGVKGVKEGDIVITDGHFSLAHDTKVKYKLEDY